MLLQAFMFECKHVFCCSLFILCRHQSVCCWVGFWQYIYWTSYFLVVDKIVIVSWWSCLFYLTVQGFQFRFWIVKMLKFSLTIPIITINRIETPPLRITNMDTWQVITFTIPIYKHNKFVKHFRIYLYLFPSWYPFKFGLQITQMQGISPYHHLQLDQNYKPGPQQWLACHFIFFQQALALYQPFKRIFYIAFPSARLMTGVIYYLLKMANSPFLDFIEIIFITTHFLFWSFIWRLTPNLIPV